MESSWEGVICIALVARQEGIDVVDMDSDRAQGQWHRARDARFSGRRRLVFLLLPLLLSACGGGGDDNPETVVSESAVSSEAPNAAATAQDGSATDARPADEEVPATLQAMLDDAQALCDALDQDEVMSIVGDFDMVEADDVLPTNSLCAFRADRAVVARVWLQGSWSEREGLRRFDTKPFTPCQAGQYEAVCQSHTGVAGSPNGWPEAAVELATLSVEAQALDPEVARQLVGAVLDDLEPS